MSEHEEAIKVLEQRLAVLQHSMNQAAHHEEYHVLEAEKHQDNQKSIHMEMEIIQASIDILKALK